MGDRKAKQCAQKGSSEDIEYEQCTFRPKTCALPKTTSASKLLKNLSLAMVTRPSKPKREGSATPGLNVSSAAEKESRLVKAFANRRRSSQMPALNKFAPPNKSRGEESSVERLRKGREVQLNAKLQ